MASLKITREIEITTAATNFTVDVLEQVDEYTIYTAAPLTIIGTSTITSTGTAYTGTTIKFNYIASVTGGTLTVFGQDIPTHLLQKTSEIVAVYTDSGWLVKLTPNFFEDGIISLDDMEKPLGSYVNAAASTSAYVSVNVAGVQNITTLKVPADTIIHNARTPFQALRITAYGSCTAALKNLFITWTDGVVTNTIFSGNVTNISGGFKVEAIMSLTPSTDSWVSDAMISPSATTPTFYTSNGGDFDCSLDQYFTFKAEELTPAGGIVTVRSFRIEKITK